MFKFIKSLNDEEKGKPGDSLNQVGHPTAALGWGENDRGEQRGKQVGNVQQGGLLNMVLKLCCLLELLGELLKIPMVRPHLRPSNSESLRVESRHQYICKVPQVILLSTQG